MPRQSRIDIPGALHQIVARGNKRRNIFEDTKDYKQFVAHLTGITATSWAAFAMDIQGKIAYTSTYKKEVLIIYLCEVAQFTSE
jgi:hypothetical protein